MTGEMHQSEVTRESFPLHFAIADALGGSVKAFDQYQGPYVVVGADITAGDPPYAVPIPGFGIRLWIQTDDGAFCTVYNENTEKESQPFWHSDESAAVDAARETLEQSRPDMYGADC